MSEKTRALYERQGRSRDIYDVVNISRNFREHVDIIKARVSLFEKFKFKNLPSPSVDIIMSQIDLKTLKSDWDGQLEHQLQILPPVESFYDELPQALSWWINENNNEVALSLISRNPNEAIDAKTDFPLQYGVGSVFNPPFINNIETIRFAARNRLCVKMQFHNSMRLIEPYSLRYPKTGNILFYGFELQKNGINTNHVKAYNVKDILGIEVTKYAFLPRYKIEF